MPAEQILGMAQRLKAHNHPQANSIISDIISELSKQSGKTCDISDKLYNRINCALNDIQPKQNNNVLSDVLKLLLEHRNPGSGSLSSSNIQPKQNNNVILDALKLVLEHRKPGSGSQSSSNIYRSHSSYSHSSSKPRDYEKEAREINERIHKQSWDDYFEKNPSPNIGSSLMGP
ncbi:hypothetical protein J6P92_04665 [bacterium]|nr:hypothetical protein [bacterium]